MKIRSVGKIRSGKKSLVTDNIVKSNNEIGDISDWLRSKETKASEKFEKSQVKNDKGLFVNEFVAENSGDSSVGIPPSSTEIIVKTQVPLTLSDKEVIEDTLREIEDMPSQKNDFFSADFVGLKKDLDAINEARDKDLYEASREASDRGWKKVKNTNTFKSWKNSRGDYVNLYLEGNSWRFQTNKRGDFLAGSTSLYENLKEAKKLREELRE
jgi:hypothetical protein